MQSISMEMNAYALESFICSMDPILNSKLLLAVAGALNY